MRYPLRGSTVALLDQRSRRDAPNPVVRTGARGQFTLNKAVRRNRVKHPPAEQSFEQVAAPYRGVRLAYVQGLLT